MLLRQTPTPMSSRLARDSRWSIWPTSWDRWSGVVGPRAATDAELDNTLRDQIAAGIELARAFPTTFDRMTTAPDGDPAREALGEAISAIEAQGETIARVATALGKTITLEV